MTPRWLLFLGLIACGFGFEEVPPNTKVPHGKDETSFVRLMTTPDKYLDQDIVICGAIGVGDFHVSKFQYPKETYYSIVFREVGETVGDLSRDRRYIYLDRETGGRVVERLLKLAEQSKSVNYLHLARVRVNLNSRAYVNTGRRWDTLEVIDVQFIADDYKSWLPWEYEKERLAAEAAEADKKSKTAAAQKAAQEMKVAAEKAAADRIAKFEALQWRDWTTPDGKKVQAKYAGINGGQLKLVTKDGESFKIPIDKLTVDESDWVKKKPWIDPDATPPKPATKKSKK